MTVTEVAKGLPLGIQAIVRTNENVYLVEVEYNTDESSYTRVVYNMNSFDVMYDTVIREVVQHLVLVSKKRK